MEGKLGARMGQKNGREVRQKLDEDHGLKWKRI
jgi:hypothetical protein